MLEIIKSSDEIAVLFSQGKRIHTSFITFIVLKRHGCPGRVAFIAGKKQGNAVWRNSAKRRMRAVCKDSKVHWAEYDVIFLAKQNILKVPYSKVLEATASALKSL